MLTAKASQADAALFHQLALAFGTERIDDARIASGEQKHCPVVLVAVEGVAVDLADDAVEHSRLRPLPHHPLPVAVALRRLGSVRTQPEGIVEVLALENVMVERHVGID